MECLVCTEVHAMHWGAGMNVDSFCSLCSTLFDGLRGSADNVLVTSQFISLVLGQARVFYTFVPLSCANIVIAFRRYKHRAFT